jgi:hypothetical protein
MIESLTKEQEALIPEYVKKYTELGLSTKPVSKERVEEIISQVYKAGKVKKPKMILHVDSPLAIFYAYAILEELEKQKIFGSNISGSVLNSVDSIVLDSVGKNVFSSVKSNVRSNIWNDVWSNVWTSVESNVLGSVESNVETNIENNVGRNVLDNILGNVWNNVWGNLWNNVYSGLLFGSHEAERLSFYAFMLYELKLKIDEINGLLNSLELGWFYVGKDVCIVSSKPSEMHLNAHGRLHNDSDMAIKYPDGYGLYAWHGVIIDWDKSWIITNPERITLESINKEQNAEVRRVMIERFTFERYIKESKAKPIDESKWGQLFSLDIGLPEPVKLVYVTNSTPEPDGTYKKYMIPVPPHIKTCLEGLAWSFEGITEEEYSNMILET